MLNFPENATVKFRFETVKSHHQDVVFEWFAEPHMQEFWDMAVPALKAFTDYFRQNVDRNTDTFFIDPDSNNPRARHVYEKAGFSFVGEYEGEKKYWDFSREKTYLMVMKCV